MKQSRRGHKRSTNRRSTPKRQSRRYNSKSTRASKRRRRSSRQRQSRWSLFKSKVPVPVDPTDAAKGHMMYLITQSCPVCDSAPDSLPCMTCRGTYIKTNKEYRMLHGSYDPFYKPPLPPPKDLSVWKKLPRFSLSRGPSASEMETKRRMEANRIICGSDVMCVRRLNEDRSRGMAESELLQRHFAR